MVEQERNSTIWVAVWEPGQQSEVELPIPHIVEKKDYTRTELRSKFADLRATKFAGTHSISYAITKSGRVFVVGQDADHLGLVGRSGVWRATLPAEISFQTPVQHIAWGATHVAAISVGKLFTWGTGNYGQLGYEGQSQIPKAVDSADIYSVQQVKWGPKSTNIRTEGGFVYTYGIISTHRSIECYSHEPYTPADFKRHFLTDIQTSHNYNAVLNELGEVYVYDNWSEITRLPVFSGVKIRHIAVFASQVYGVDNDCTNLYKWSFGCIVERSVCPLPNCKTMVFRLADELESIQKIKVDDDTIGLVYTGEKCTVPIGELVGNLDPYKRQMSTQQLLSQVQISLENPLALVSPRQSTGTGFTKIIKYRTQHLQIDCIQKGIAQPTLRTIRDTFDHIQAFAESNALHRRTQGRVLLPNVLAKTFEKYRYSSISIGFSRLKDFNQSYTANLARFKERNHLAAQFKLEAARSIFRLIVSDKARAQKRQASTFLSKLKELNLAQIKRISVLMYIRQHLAFLTHVKWLRTLTHWKDVSLRSAILDQGCYKLGEFIQMKMLGTSFLILMNNVKLFEKQKKSLSKIMSFISPRIAQHLLNSKFVLWHNTVKCYKVIMITRKRLYSFACRTFSNYSRKLTALQLSRPFSLIQSSQLRAEALKKWKIPLFMFVANLSKRFESRMVFAFNAIFRSQTDMKVNELWILLKAVEDIPMDWVPTGVTSQESSISLGSTKDNTNGAQIFKFLPKSKDQSPSPIAMDAHTSLRIPTPLTLEIAQRLSQVPTPKNGRENLGFLLSPTSAFNYFLKTPKRKNLLKNRNDTRQKAIDYARNLELRRKRIMMKRAKSENQSRLAHMRQFPICGSQNFRQRQKGIVAIVSALERAVNTRGVIGFNRIRIFYRDPDPVDMSRYDLPRLISN